MLSYKTWFERRPRLLELEIEEFKSHNLKFHLNDNLKSESRAIAFNGKVLVNEEEVELELCYPSEFPAQPIIVKAQEKNIYRHQNPFEKNLCLIPHDQEGWDSQMTGAYMVQQAIRLLEDIEKGEKAVAENEVNSPEPWSNYINFRYVPLLITQLLPNSLNGCGEYTISRYPGHYYENLSHNLIYENHHVLEQISFNEEIFEMEKTLPFQNTKTTAPKEKGFWFYLPSPPNFDIYSSNITIEELSKVHGNTKEFVQLRGEISKYKNIEIAKRKLKKQPQQKKINKPAFPPHFALVFDEENYERNQYRKAFIWGVYHLDDDKFLYSPPQYITVEEHFKRIPELSSLAEKNVLIAGLGSLGSAVAIELGKCGVGSFTLIDKDSLETGNLVRHTGTLDYVGVSKTKLLEKQILSHYPFAQIKRLNCLIGSDVETMQEIFKNVNESDLVINLTAEESVIKIFNRFGLELKVPVIHGWISNGAWGGCVLRSIPGETGCYHCQGENNKIEVMSSSSSEIYPRGCGFPTFPGASFDIYEVASQTVRMAVNTLLEKEIGYDQVIIQNYPEPKIEVSTRKKDTNCVLCGD